jgi:hypothetical protein
VYTPGMLPDGRGSDVYTPRNRTPTVREGYPQTMGVHPSIRGMFRRAGAAMMVACEVSFQQQTKRRHQCLTYYNLFPVQ